MKISKLFHWLYAILMLLPFAFFVPSVLYYAFNDNATMQTVEVPKTEIVAVDFNQLQPNEVYDFEGDLAIYQRIFQNQYYGNIDVNDIIYFRFDYRTDIDSIYLCFGRGENQTNSMSSARLTADYEWHFFDKRTNITNIWNNYEYTYFMSFANFTDAKIQVSNFEMFNLTKMFGSGNEPTIEVFNQMFPLDYYDYTESEFMQITYDTGEIEQLVSNTDIINYAWESIWNLPLFSWCKVSFVATPFTYITGLFGLAASNSFNYVFTYFASMSIIWLVFDVILYVPLLVHRWLDKGIVE